MQGILAVRCKRSSSMDAPQQPGFCNRAAADAYIAQQKPASERLFLQAAVSTAVTQLLTNHQLPRDSEPPVDLLLLVHLLKPLCRTPQYLRAILSDRYETLEQVWDALDDQFT